MVKMFNFYLIHSANNINTVHSDRVLEESLSEQEESYFMPEVIESNENTNYTTYYT